jgi:hypothetical protein
MQVIIVPHQRTAGIAGWQPGLGFLTKGNEGIKANEENSS